MVKKWLKRERKGWFWSSVLCCKHTAISMKISIHIPTEYPAHTAVRIVLGTAALIRHSTSNSRKNQTFHFPSFAYPCTNSSLCMVNNQKKSNAESALIVITENCFFSSSVISLFLNKRVSEEIIGKRRWNVKKWAWFCREFVGFRCGGLIF